ncbi:hypothetical protein L3067_04120 [Xanthomonas sp. PPL568]|uniref:hypothetical protein n=1 Tax=Xanthomonas indica TaxID=2912242 RepID=UPI001F58C853|nr:hypothetical protein [Xanthomonas indica]MCI2243793.1 hypothetical protein [Xanthomonas indica]
MRLFAFVAAVLCAPAAGATDLLCDGQLFIPGRDPVPYSSLASVDAEAGTVRIKTLNGWAVGPLGTDPQTYMGTLATPSGKSYWYNLDRYTGEAMWMLSQTSVVEFTGKCKPARPMF